MAMGHWCGWDFWKYKGVGCKGSGWWEFFKKAPEFLAKYLQNWSSGQLSASTDISGKAVLLDHWHDGICGVCVKLWRLLQGGGVITLPFFLRCPRAISCETHASMSFGSLS